MYPHAALRYPTYRGSSHAITLGIRDRTKLPALKARKHRPCGFDSHRPLHFPPTLVNDSELDLDNFDDALQRRKVGGISCVERQSIGCGR
jgi:hypothetical protein